MPESLSGIFCVVIIDATYNDRISLSKVGYTFELQSSPL